MSTGKLTIERVYLITSLSVFDANCIELATWIRGHWGIENLLHHVRDRTFREDDSKVRTGTLPRAMASLRSLAISVFRQDARPTSPPPSATPAATTTGPYEPSASRDEPRQISITPCPWSRMEFRLTALTRSSSRLWARAKRRTVEWSSRSSRRIAASDIPVDSRCCTARPCGRPADVVAP